MELSVNLRRGAILNFSILLIFISLEIAFFPAFSKTIALLAFLYSVIFVAFLNCNLLLSLYIFFLPITPILPDSANLFGILGIDEIVSIGILFYIFERKIPQEKQTSIQKIVVKILFLIFLYNVYRLGKNTFFGNSQTDWAYFGKNCIKYSLRFLPLIYIVTRLNYLAVRNYVLAGAFMSIIAISLSMYFNDFLSQHGILVKEGFLDQEGTGALRIRGIFRSDGGDVNSAGVFMAIAFGYVIGLIEKGEKLKYFIPLLLASLIGVFLTASRTAMISILFVVVLFAFMNWKKPQGLKVIGIVLLLLLITSPFIYSAIQRFYSQSFGAAFDSTRDVGRAVYYKVYGNYFLSHPISLVTGFIEKINFNRAPHNSFVKMTYDAGLLFSITYLFYLIKLFRSCKLETSRFNFLYIFVPLIFILLTVSELGASIYFWIFISAIPFLNDPNLNEDIGKVHSNVGQLNSA